MSALHKASGGAAKLLRRVLTGLACISLCGILTSCGIFAYLSSPKSTRQAYDDYVNKAKQEGYEPMGFTEDWRDDSLRRLLANPARDAAQNTSRSLASNVKIAKPETPEVKVNQRKPDVKRACFVAGTLVQTPEGPRRIERIQVGDEVLSFNEKTGRVEPAAVSALIHARRSDLVEIKSPNGTVTCSANHRFYTPEGTWKEAEDLGPDARLMCRDQTGLQLISVPVSTQPKNLAIPALVFNLTVEDNSTFFAGPDALCHNCSKGAKPKHTR